MLEHGTSHPDNNYKTVFNTSLFLQATLPMENHNSSRHKWKEDNMKATIDAVKSIKYGVEVSGKNFNVPKTTLRRKVLDKNKVAKGANRSFLVVLSLCSLQKNLKYCGLNSVHVFVFYKRTIRYNLISSK